MFNSRILFFHSLVLQQRSAFLWQPSESIAPSTAAVVPGAESDLVIGAGRFLQNTAVHVSSFHEHRACTALWVKFVYSFFFTFAVSSTFSCSRWMSDLCCHACVCPPQPPMENQWKVVPNKMKKPLASYKTSVPHLGERRVLPREDFHSRLPGNSCAEIKTSLCTFYFLSSTTMPIYGGGACLGVC